MQPCVCVRVDMVMFRASVLVCVCVSCVTGVVVEGANNSGTDPDRDNKLFAQYDATNSLFDRKCGKYGEKDYTQGDKSPAAAGACWAFTATWLYQLLADKFLDEPTFIEICSFMFVRRFDGGKSLSGKDVPKFPHGYGFPTNSQNKVFATSMDQDQPLVYSDLIASKFGSKAYATFSGPAYKEIRCISRSLYPQIAPGYGNTLLGELIDLHTKSVRIAFAIGFNYADHAKKGDGKHGKNAAFHYVPGQVAQTDTRKYLCYADGFGGIAEYCYLRFIRDRALTSINMMIADTNMEHTQIDYVERIIGCTRGATNTAFKTGTAWASCGTQKPNDYANLVKEQRKKTDITIADTEKCGTDGDNLETE